MKLTDLLSPDGVFVLSASTSKKRLLHEIAERAHGLYGLCTETTAQALLEREALGPTGVGQGVALPHARIAGLTDMRALFFRLTRPLAFDSVDRKPVDLVMALLAPEEANERHLKALALVSRTLRDPDLQSRLRANDDPAAIFGLLTESNSSRAA